MASDHADTVQKVDAPAQSTPAPAAKTPGTSVDNDAQAALAEQQREYTTNIRTGWTLSNDGAANRVP